MWFQETVSLACLSPPYSLAHQIPQRDVHRVINPLWLAHIQVVVRYGHKFSVPRICTLHGHNMEGQ